MKNTDYIENINNIINIFRAYTNGYFPMGINKNSPEIEWVIPGTRGIIPIGKLHCSKSLRKIIKKNIFEISFNSNFEEVIENCSNREQTWINSTIINLFNDLHILGYAHSVEVKKNKRLVGGLYGLSLGNIFFAESMFSIIPNTSKLALIAMMAKLNYGGFKIFDTQFPSKHLSSMGGIAISQSEFKKNINYLFDTNANFDRLPYLCNWEQFIKYGIKN